MPGMKEMTLRIPQTEIKKIASLIPSPLGELSIQWDLNKNRKRRLNLEVPAGMEIKLDLNDVDTANRKSIEINGKKILLKENQKFQYQLPSGKWELAF
jgi:hypothetical protein